MRSSLARYYDHLDDLVVMVPTSGRGWTGRDLPVKECCSIVRAVDRRGIARFIEGDWVDGDEPMNAETRQRQAGVDALSDVEWILQIDNDEVLPRIESLLAVLEDAPDATSVEWPMRVLFRRRGADYLEVTGKDGAPSCEYPGPVAVRRGTRLAYSRRTEAPSLRVLVVDADDAGDGVPAVSLADAAWHNSWARGVGQTWRKIRTWGHADGLRMTYYLVATWLPAPVTWRLLHDFHPLFGSVWPALGRTRLPEGLLLVEDAR